MREQLPALNPSHPQLTADTRFAISAAPFPMLPFRLLATAATLSVTATASAVDVTVSNDQFLGDSVWEFSNVQGTNGWNYGYYNLTGDLTAGYDPAADFQLMATSGSGYAVGGNPPWTNIFALTGHPNGTNNGAEHWAIRRYTIQPGEAGNLALSWFLRDTGPGGDGVIGAVLLNGTEVATQALAAGDTTGLRMSVNLTVSAGDKLDLALKPGLTDGNDSAEFGMRLIGKRQVTFTGATLLADSQADFSGTQGLNGWTYGQYNITANGQPSIGGANFEPFAPTVYDGGKWDVVSGTAPWTEISATGGHPNGANNASEIWATRRYTVQPGEAGSLLVEWNLSKGNPSGDGTTVRILLNGALVDAYAVEGTDTTGVKRGAVLNNVSVGDVIDVALTAQGLQNFATGTGNASNDGADGSIFGARIYAVPEPTTAAFLLGSIALAARRRRRA